MDARLRDFIMSRFQPDLVTEPKYVAWHLGELGSWLVGWLAGSLVGGLVGW